MIPFNQGFIIKAKCKETELFNQSENNLDERVSLGNRSRESLREKLSICNSESFHGPPALVSPVSTGRGSLPGAGSDIPKILVHTLGREETIESTLSSENQNSDFSQICGLEHIL